MDVVFPDEGTVEWVPVGGGVGAKVGITESDRDGHTTEEKYAAVREPGAATIGRRHTELGARVARLREARNWSYRQVADAAGLGASDVFRVEVGKTENPTLRTLVALSRAFGVSVGVLLGEEGES